MTDPASITALAEREAASFHRAQAQRFAECALNLMAVHMTIPEVREWLRTQEQHLAEFG